MKHLVVYCLLFGAVVLGVPACSKKQDPIQELEKASAAMDKSAPAAAAPPAQPAASTPAAPSAASAVVLPPGQQVKTAIAEYKAGNMEDAVTRLQLLRNTGTLTAQQRMALQDSLGTLMTEIYTLAEKGDKRAIAARARYEQMQTAR